MTTMPAAGDSRAGLAGDVRTWPNQVLSTWTATPGRLRLEASLIVALAVLTGVLGFVVIGRQLGATSRIANESAPAIVNARQVQTNLAEANAAAAVAFLAGGVENPEQRQIYTESLDAAAAELESAARLIGDDDEAHEALADMTGALPRYSGAIEAARANNRQGFPVGAEYLNEANTILTDEIYPATDTVANQAAASYRSAYDGQRGVDLVLGLVVAGVGVLLVLVLLAVQLQLQRLFKRTLNPLMVLATVLTVGLVVWLSYGFTAQVTNLSAARDDGYIGSRLYLDLRSAAFGAKADEAQFLIAQGAGDGFQNSFEARETQIQDLRAELEAHADDSSSPSEAHRLIDDTYAAWDSYAQVHGEVVTADEAGDRDTAVSTALDRSVSTFGAFDEVTSEALDANRATFDSEMDDAQRALRGLQYGALLALVAIAGLAAFGLQQRIREYR